MADSLSGLVAPRLRQPGPRSPTRIWLAAVLLLLAAAPAVVSAQRPNNWPNPWPNHFPEPPANPPAQPVRVDPSNAVIDQYMRRGNDYLVGHGVPQDPVQAAYWYKKAADMGNPDAQTEIGYFYLHGIGVPRDDALAATWFMRGVGGGSPMAKLNLAVLYLKGIGVTRDPKLGVDLLNQLAEKGDPRANAYLGILYLDGIGVPPDQALAEKYIEKAAKKKSPEGQYALGRLFSTVPQHAHDLQTALKWFRSAAAAGYVPAMSALGILLVHHPELKERKDPEEGVTLLQRAAEAGRWESSATLGDLARTGAAGHQNAREAFRWFTIAARQGGAIAEKETRAQLDYYRGVLPADQQDWELQQADAWLAQHPERDLYLLKDGFKILAGASRDLAE